MKQKIGIVTLYGLFNFGNRLQNYATQVVFEELGYDVVTLVNTSFINTPKFINRVKHFIKCLISSSYRSQDEISKSRNTKFIEFELNIKEKKTNNKELNELKDQFEYFVVGSDQVWNPYFMESQEWYLLDFCDAKQKVTMAPSIGIVDIPESFEVKLKKSLSTYAYISCREESGSEIIRSITGKDVTTVIDPTMMLTVQQWDKVIKKPTFEVNKKYVFLYFLGNITDEYLKLIEKLKNDGYDIINILDRSRPFYVCGPSEFVWLIKNSQLVLTDSFHACVFSILYEKPFVAFDRVDSSKSMNSRIATLTKKFGLEGRLYENVVYEAIFYIDYCDIKTKLEIERDKVYKFLKSSLMEDE